MANKRHAVFVVREDEKERGKSYWNRCGVAFENQDGSFNIKLDMFPGLSLQLREQVDRDEDREPRDREQSRGGNDNRSSSGNRDRDSRGNGNRR